MIGILTSTDEPAVVILATDPAVERANEPEVLAQYRYNGDPDTLTIPTDATEVVVRALTESELTRARVSAGRLDRRGQRLFTEAVQANAIARVAAESDKSLSPAEADTLVLTAHEEWVDTLSAEDATHFERHEAWLDEQVREVCRLGVIEVRGLELVPEQGRFPIEVFETGMTHWFAAENTGRLGLHVLRELASHIQSLGRLGKARRTSSATSSGADTTTPSPGPAPSASPSSSPS